jgi:hypothetical protein
LPPFTEGLLIEDIKISYMPYNANSKIRIGISYLQSSGKIENGDNFNLSMKSSLIQTY